jgi:crotonyl-CoA carboxylase/reductase
MKAIVIRRGAEGEPISSMTLAEVPVPEPGPGQVLVLVMAAGVNFNGVWAARGRPVSVFRGRPGDDLHIPGSDASGIVWKVGPGVRRWRAGDEVVVHCNQSCGECPECNGLDPLACSEQKIWGYETSWGSFAQFCLVQSQQLLPRPACLSWEEAASYGLTCFTAYRMLVTQARVQAGERVLVWGAAGGLGVFALQLCRLVGATPIAVVSGSERAAFARQFGAELVIDRSGFDLASGDVAALKSFGAAVRAATGGHDPDVVFEHVGRETFRASVFLLRRFGRVVTCGATTGYDLAFDVRHLWMRQKSIIGSHFANAHEAHCANQLMASGALRPALDQVFPFEETGLAHQVMADNRHKGKMAIRIQAASPTPDTERAR